MLLFLFALVAHNSPASSQKQNLYIFGTILNIELVDVDSTVADSVFNSLSHAFVRMHQDWHAWKPPGELYQVNRQIADGRKSIEVSDSLLALMGVSKKLYEASDGLFNPAIGKLVSLWGFQQDERPHAQPPPDTEINRIQRQHPGMDDIDIGNKRIISHNRAVSLDFGGFAKGYALDQARTILRKQHVSNAMLNAGGDLCAMGARGGRPWRVAIRHPQGRGVMASVDVGREECVMTSGNYERYLEHKGVRYNHILDARTGYPVQGVVSVTVIDKSGGLADAAATALTVAGSREWYAVARKLGLKYVMLVDDNGVVHMDPDMQQRIRFEGGRPAHIVISPPL